MNICLISGPYIPGKCGISDYIQLISIEFEKKGHDIIRIYKDRNKVLPNLENNLPSADLYSIQFAPYAFSDDGLIEKELFDLAKSLSSKKTHLNFHEIWIGAYPKASLKKRFIGWRQKRKINEFIKHLKPNLITCSNAAALDRLNSSGINAKYLYLFGNIPKASIEKESSSNITKAVFFGTLYENFPYRLFGQKLNEFSKFQKSPVQISIIGRQREKVGLNLLKRISEDYNFSIIECGELDTESISKKLQISDIGIATTPYDILGKSGAAAAMLEHGLPLITHDDGDTPHKKLFVFNNFSDQVFLLNDQKLSDRIISFIQKRRKPFFLTELHILLMKC